MILNPLTYHRPASLEEALVLLRELPDAKFLAGGTMLINRLKTAKRSGLKTPQNLISLKGISELKGIQDEGEAGLCIKSMTTLSEVIQHPNPGCLSFLTAFQSICSLIGTTQIRNMGTIGGNLASRYTWTELGAVLMTLNASLYFQDPEGQERVSSAEKFFRDGARISGILTRIRIPRMPDTRMCYFRKPRVSEVDIPLMAVCAQARIKEARFQELRITVNRGTLFPQRCSDLETALTGAVAEADTVAAIVSGIDPESIDPQCDEYKRHMYHIAIRDAILGLLKE